MKSLGNTCLAAVIAYLSHYGAIKLYTNVCLPSGFSGFLQGTVTAGSPVCAGALTIASQSHLAYSTILITSLSRIFVDYMPWNMTCRRSRPTATAANSVESKAS